MGYSVSYFAFRNRKAEDVFREISLRPSGQFEEIAESEVVSCPLPDHWSGSLPPAARGPIM